MTALPNSSFFARGLQGFRLRVAAELQPTGIPPLDTLLGGGLPRGSIVELCGSASSGRTSLSFSLLASATDRQETCAYVDVSDALDPLSLASAGVDLNRLLWIRCGSGETTNPPQPRSSSMRSSVPAHNTAPTFIENTAAKAKRTQVWQHPRDQIRGLEASLPSLLHQREQETTSSRSPGILPATLPFPESTNPPRVLKLALEPPKFNQHSALPRGSYRDSQRNTKRASSTNKPWKSLEQALKTTDLLLHSGGWGLIVFDLGNIPWVDARRIELSTWFRFRRAIEDTPAILLLLGEQSCAKSCSSLVLHCQRRRESWNAASAQTKTPAIATLEGFAVEGTVLCSRTGLQPMDSAHWNTKTLWTDSF
ncbi:MAG: ATPase domain-containing protein [Candidatus Acidiferrum sp.]